MSVQPMGRWLERGCVEMGEIGDCLEGFLAENQ